MRVESELKIIFGEEFRRQLRNKGFLFFTALLVAVMILSIPLAPVVVDWLDDDDGAPAAEVRAEPESGRFGYVDPSGLLAPAAGGPPRFDSLDDGLAALRDGSLDSIFAVPADYLTSGAVAEYWVRPANAGLFVGNWDARGEFHRLVRQALLGGQVPPDVLARVLDPGSFETTEVARSGGVEDAEPLASTIAQLIVPILFGLLLLIAVMSGGGALMRAISEERETRMIELLVTSASPMSIMVGKLGALVLAGLLHIAVWIAVGAFVIPQVIDSALGGGELIISARILAVTIVAFLIGYLLFSVLALFVGTVVSSSAEAQRQMGLVSLFAGLPVWLTGLLINSPDNTFAQILSYFPFTAPTMVMMRLGSGSEMSNGEIAVSLAIAALAGAVLLYISARVFRVAILLAGQSIRPGTVVAAIRQSG